MFASGSAAAGNSVFLLCLVQTTGAYKKQVDCVNFVSAGCRWNRLWRGVFYSVFCGELSDRFRDFYRSFATVMGAQITISLINTVLTAIFVLGVRLPDAPLLIALTFLCGLLPIVGNLVSNTIIVCVAFTVS